MKIDDKGILKLFKMALTRDAKKMTIASLFSQYSDSSDGVSKNGFITLLNNSTVKTASKSVSKNADSIFNQCGQYFDVNGDGSISYDEFSEGLEMYYDISQDKLPNMTIEQLIDNLMNPSNNEEDEDNPQ